MSTCLMPLTILNKNRTLSRQEASFPVPCGKCPNCLRRRSNSWIFRLKEEQKVSNTSAFITLTYDDEHIKKTFNGFPTLDKTDYQKFMKRLRKQVNYYVPNHSKIRYYACGEYGGRTHRPHYHAIMFDVPRLFLDNPSHLESIWKNGFVRVDECNSATIAYVTKYVMKQIRLEERKDFDDREFEFSLMSKGMGLSYITPSVSKFYKRKKLPYIVVEDGQKIPMPRYFREKLYTEEERKEVVRKALEYLELNTQELTGKQELELVQDALRKQRKKVKLNRNTF